MLSHQSFMPDLYLSHPMLLSSLPFSSSKLFTICRHWSIPVYMLKSRLLLMLLRRRARFVDITRACAMESPVSSSPMLRNQVHSCRNINKNEGICYCDKSMSTNQQIYCMRGVASQVQLYAATQLYQKHLKTTRQTY